MLLLHNAAVKEIEEPAGAIHQHKHTASIAQQASVTQSRRSQSIAIVWEGAYITLEVLGVVQGVEALARHTIPAHQELHIVPLKVTCNSSGSQSIQAFCLTTAPS